MILLPRIRGFGLIELMVAIVLGMIVTAAITSMVVAILRTNNENMEMTRLTQELRAAGQLITRDLRRASFTPKAVENIGRVNGSASAPIVNPFAEIDFYAGGTEIDFVSNPTAGPADCVFFRYDDQTNGTQGTLDAADNRGFRFNSDTNAIEMLDGVDSSCTSDDGWEALTDTNATEVTGFNFSTKDQDAFKHLTAGDLEVTVRQIVVTISGRVAADPEVNRTITELIRIRNDLMLNCDPSNPSLPPECT